jgi:hypothetical protein
LKRLVHFILVAGELIPDYERAIRTAKVHGAPILLWYVGNKPKGIKRLGIEALKIEIPDWLAHLEKAHIYDVLAYKIAYEMGGLFLPLDSISLQSAWHLLPSDKEMAFSTDWPAADHERFPHYYNNIFISRMGSQMPLLLFAEATRRVLYEKEEWGFTGPLMLTDFIARYSDRVVGTPYNTLCGWSSGYIWRFYLGMERPPPETCVIHLFRQAYRLLAERKYDEWAAVYPAYAGPVKERTDLNDDLLLT